jgi:hypothetical protein
MQKSRKRIKEIAKGSLKLQKRQRNSSLFNHTMKAELKDFELSKHSTRVKPKRRDSIDSKNSIYSNADNTNKAV